MTKTIWIHKQGSQYVMAAGEQNSVGRGTTIAHWDSVSYRLSVLGFSDASIHATKTKFDTGETSVMLTVLDSER